MKKQYLFLAAILCVINACKKEPIETINQPEDHFSYIRAGNLWVYDFIYDGKVVDSLIRQITGQDSAKIYSGFVKDSHMKVEEFYFKQGKNLMYYYTKGQQASLAVVLAKDNRVHGETWVKWDGTDSSRVTVKMTDKEVKTPVGDFMCYTLEEKNLHTGLVVSYDISPVYGLIQINENYHGHIISYLLRRKNF